MKSWREFEQFEFVDLEDSFITDWVVTEEAFVITLEVSLWPGHEAYEPPKKGEYTCYKVGRLLFSKPENIDGLLKKENVMPSKSVNGEISDYETIESFEVDGNYCKVTGDFGNVSLSAESWNFKLARVLR